MKTIEIIISPAGAAKIQTRGFAGASCLEASRFLEQALGARLTEERTTDFYEPTQISAMFEQQRGG